MHISYLQCNQAECYGWWLVHMLLVLSVLSSILGLDWGFWWPFSLLRGICWDNNVILYRAVVTMCTASNSACSSLWVSIGSLNKQGKLKLNFLRAMKYFLGYILIKFNLNSICPLKVNKRRSLPQPSGVITHTILPLDTTYALEKRRKTCLNVIGRCHLNN